MTASGIADAASAIFADRDRARLTERDPRSAAPAELLAIPGGREN